MCVVIRFMLLILFSGCENAMLKFVPKSNQDTKLQVKVPQGIVQGRIDYTINRKLSYYAFKGIPYATPPVGKLRFKPPIAAKSWNGILDGSSLIVPSCIQITPSFLIDYPESEDCLYVNVYTPLRSLSNVTSLLPVMVWIYGGGFLTGSADNIYYGPDYLLEQDVVVIQFAYRLGAFGFLSTGDMESPGNYGLKDQHLALRWIKENVQYFGGDPNKITIFGESAGGSCVEYQLLYPANRGIIYGAISQSGTSLNIWAFQKYPKRIAFKLGRATGIVTNSTAMLVEYLRTLPASNVKTAALKTVFEETPGIIHGIVFSPTIEPSHPEAFLTDKPHQMLAEGKFIKVPRIIGFNSGEVVYTKQYEATIAILSSMLGKMLSDPNAILPNGVGEKAVNEVRKHYFENGKPLSVRYMEYTNDAYFYRPIIESATLHQEYCPTFLYVFSYEGYLGRSAIGFNKDDYRNVVHSEELVYLFSRRYLPKARSMDKVVRARMVKMWTNFAKTGNPTPAQDKFMQNVIWPLLSPNMTYLNIGKTLMIDSYPKKEAMMFWKGIYEKYGKPPYDTY